MRLFLALLFVLLLAGIGAAFLIWPDDDPDKLVEASTGESHFVYARAYARDEATAAGGYADRLAFVALFPNFAPVNRAAQPAGPRAARELVFVTIAPQDESGDPAERPTRLYSRFFEPDASSGPGGLILRRFEAGSPYDLEEIFLAPPAGRAFFARCPKAAAAGATPAEPCLSVFRVGALDVELRFQPALLAYWETLIDGARGFVGRLAGQGRRRR
jgi:hypothetical protein